MRVNQEVQRRIMKIADRLVDRQVSLAIGQSFLYRIDKTWVQTGKGRGYWRNKPAVIETDPEVIQAYLDGAFDDRSEDEGGSSYYFITTKEPSGQDVERLLNRAIGPAPKTLELTNPDGSLKSIVIMKYGNERGDKSTRKAD